MTKTEQRVVDALKNNAGKCTDYSELILGYAEMDDKQRVSARRALSVHICNVKKKLSGVVIDSVNGKGYIYKEAEA